MHSSNRHSTVEPVSRLGKTTVHFTPAKTNGRSIFRESNYNMNITNTFGTSLKMIEKKVTSRIIESMKPADIDTLEGKDLKVVLEGLTLEKEQDKTIS